MFLEVFFAVSHSTCDFCIRCRDSVKIYKNKWAPKKKNVIICRRQLITEMILIIFIVIAFVWSHHRLIKSKGIYTNITNKTKKNRIAHCLFLFQCYFAIIIVIIIFLWRLPFLCGVHLDCFNEFCGVVVVAIYASELGCII